jgi:tetratricopeptide (TPR) repeat protein
MFSAPHSLRAQLFLGNSASSVARGCTRCIQLWYSIIYRYSLALRRPAVAILLAIWLVPLLTRAEPDYRDATEAALRSAQLYTRGDLEGAVQVLRNAIRLWPQNPKLHFMLANGLFRQREWSGAIQHYREAAQLRTQHPDTHLGLGYACYRDGRTDEAVMAWRTAVHQSPYDALPHLSLAVGLQTQGQLVEAHHHAARALGLDPGWQQRIAGDIRWTEEMRREVSSLIEQVVQGGAASPVQK